MLLYGTLLFSPSVLEKIWALVPPLGAEVPGALQKSPSVVVALLRTGLLSRVPVLAALDEPRGPAETQEASGSRPPSPGPA